MKKFLNIDDRITFYLKALALLLTISATVGFVTAQQFSLEARMAMEQVAQELAFVDKLDASSMFLLIALNNTVKSFFMMLLGVLWGVLPVVFILINGYVFGVVTSVVMTEYGFASVLFGTIPHGVFELFAVLLAASYGVWLGEMFIKTLKGKGSIGPSIRTAMQAFAKIVLPLLIIAALIETFISSHVLNVFIS